MTIKGLNKLLESRAPSAFKKKSVSEFRGKSIAIDISIWLNKNIRIKQKELYAQLTCPIEAISNEELMRQLLKCFLNELSYWLTHGITPIIVFDGERPKSKDAVRAKRTEEKQKQCDKIQELIAEYERSPLTFNQVDKLLSLRGNYVPKLTQPLALLEKASELLGIPYITAIQEAEQLCSMLCIEGMVAAVISTDTDNLAYGCPILITSVNKYKDEFDVVIYSEILTELECDADFFTDVCILGGCDYNQSVGGIQAITAFDLLKIHGSYKKYEANGDRDFSLVNYEECKRRFSFTKSFLLVHPCHALIPSLIVSEQSALFIEFMNEYNLQTDYILDAFAIFSAIKRVMK